MQNQAKIRVFVQTGGTIIFKSPGEKTVDIKKKISFQNLMLKFRENKSDH